MSNVGSLRFALDGSMLVLEAWTPRPKQTPVGVLHVWNVGTGQRDVIDDEPRPLRLLAFSPDGRTLATAERPRWQWTGPYQVALRNLRGETHRTWTVAQSAMDLSFAADGTTLLLRGPNDFWQQSSTTLLIAASDRPSAVLLHRPYQPGRGAPNDPHRNS